MMKMLRIVLAVGLIVLGVSVARVSSADCCRISCTGGATSLHACFSDLNACDSIECPPGTTASSIGVGSGATCGVNDFASCPLTERGQCFDGVNNDGWKDSVVDAADSDCQRHGAPAVGQGGLVVLAALIFGFGVHALRRRA
jgi:hypothetical protein